ncbi:hypothetical protein PINS_up004408 [Pythium insidiosum]|nr:hypothetical protein PINS_up004408 [Pythium insidiosum]
MEQDDAVAFATIEASEWFQKKHWRIPGVLNAFPRLLRTERVTPISLSLDVTSGGLPTTVVDWRGCFVDWSLCHPNHAEALGFRRCQLPLDDAMQPDWSSLSVRFSNVPAMQVLRDCRLEVSFLCRGWLCCLAPRVIASGYGGFCDVLQDESTALSHGYTPLQPDFPRIHSRPYMASAVFMAARDGDDGGVRRLLHEDASAVEKTDAQQALRHASELGHLSVVNALLTAGVSVDASSEDGRTALHVAAIQGRIDVVHCLLEANADVEKRTAQTSATPLLAACIGGSVAVVQLLIDHGADVLATNAVTRWLG